MPAKRRYALRSSGLGSERPSKQPCLSFPPPSPASLKIPPRNLKSTRSQVSQSPLAKHEQSHTERIEDSIICAPFEPSPSALAVPDVKDAERQPSPPATPPKINSPASIISQDLPAKEPVVVSVIVETVADSRVETSATGISREAAIESDSTPSATTESPSGLSGHEPITGPELCNKPELTSNSASISSSKPVADPEPIKSPEPVSDFDFAALMIQFHRHRVERSFLNHMSADLLQLKAKSTAPIFPKALFDLEILQSTLPPMQQPPWRQGRPKALQPIRDQMSSPAPSMNQTQSFPARLIRQCTYY